MPVKSISNLNGNYRNTYEILQLQKPFLINLLHSYSKARWNLLLFLLAGLLDLILIPKCLFNYNYSTFMKWRQNEWFLHLKEGQGQLLKKIIVQMHWLLMQSRFKYLFYGIAMKLGLEVLAIQNHDSIKTHDPLLEFYFLQVN